MDVRNKQGVKASKQRRSVRMAPGTQQRGQGILAPMSNTSRANTNRNSTNTKNTTNTSVGVRMSPMSNTTNTRRAKTNRNTTNNTRGANTNRNTATNTADQIPTETQEEQIPTETQGEQIPTETPPTTPAEPTPVPMQLRELR